MKFTIYEKAQDELLRELELCVEIRKMILLSDTPPEKKRYQMERLAEEEFCLNVALLYQGSKDGHMEAMLDFLSPDENGVKVDFGSNERCRAYMFLLCDMLAKLNLNVISRRGKLVHLYDQLTTLIENARIEGCRGYVLYNEDFWNQYFAFYEEYQNAAKELDCERIRFITSFGNHADEDDNDDEDNDDFEDA